MDLIYPLNEIELFPVDYANAATWDKLLAACPELSKWGVQVLMEGFREHVKLVALERRYVCKDHRNLHSNYYSKRFLIPESNCARLHFFGRADLSKADILAGAEKAVESYVGFSVIRPVGERCLGRTVIDPEKVGLKYADGYCCLRTRFTVRINGAKYSVRGYPYTAQDMEATVCAHSALWGMCRYLSERYQGYHEVYPFDLIRMTGHQEGRPFPYRGMTYKDYCEILSKFGAFPHYRVLRAPSKPGDWDDHAFRDAYSLVESGFPVLASLRLPAVSPTPTTQKHDAVGHVVSLIGHTYDPNKSIDPKVDLSADPFLDSSFFLTSFLVCDDNRFPYAKLGFKGDAYNDYEGSYNAYHIKSICVVTCPMPEKVYLAPSKARAKAMRYIRRILPDLDKAGKRPFVVRLFLTTCNALREGMLSMALKGDQAAELLSSLHLPHFVWVLEVGPLEEYRNGKATALLILDPTAGPGPAGVIAMRIGNAIRMPKKTSGAPDTKELRFDSAPAAFGQFTHNLGTRHNSC